MSKRILILSVHPDDTTIAFSALIQKAISKGDLVKEALFALGGPASKDNLEIRKSEWKEVGKFSHITEQVVMHEGYDGMLDTIPSCQLTGEIDRLIEVYQPDEVYCTPDSEHADHHALYKAFLGACRLKTGWQPKLMAVGTYMFSNQLYNQPTGGKIFQPMTDEMMKMKLDEFSLYKSQIKPAPSPLGLDSIEVMARYYGMMCGCKYAEMYYQLRYIREV